ncbi:hypothetical protein Tco_0649878, partial [Tanacetum coccineum]
DIFIRASRLKKVMADKGKKSSMETFAPKSWGNGCVKGLCQRTVRAERTAHDSGARVVRSGAQEEDEDKSLKCGANGCPSKCAAVQFLVPFSILLTWHHFFRTARAERLHRSHRSNDKAYYYSGITSIAVNGKNACELKGKFLDDLHNNPFSGTNGKDAVEHIEYYLKIVDPIKLPNVDHDKMRIVVFPISLAGGARRCWIEDGYCNGGNLPGAYHIENSLHHQDLEWYEALEDSELKDEALRNKAIMEGLISDDESCNDCWKIWKSHEINYHDYNEGEYEN